MTKDGTLGRLALVGDATTICINQSVAVIRPNVRVDPQFLKLLLESPHYQRQMIEDAGGSTIKHIYITIVDKMPIGLPLNKIEQQAIVKALSDVDALINSLDELIAKKRDIKQAGMQQLLAGKKRLPGFEQKKGFKQTNFGLIPEDWGALTFDDLFNITAGGDADYQRLKPYRDEIFKYPLYSNSLINKGLYGYCSYFAHPAGSITITARGMIGCANFREQPYIAIGRVLILQSKNGLAGIFFTEVINNLVKFAIESTGVPQLTAPQISTYWLPVPPHSEQIAIAEVLSDMDSELIALEQRRDKTMLLKQGMMQELLTGKIRLI